MPDPKFQLSLDAKMLIELMSECSVGDTVTYEDMDRVLGRDVRKHCRGAIQTARRRLMNEAQFVFEAVPTVGYKRLADGEIVGSMERDRKGVQRKARKSLRKLACVQFERLDKEEKVTHTVAAAQMGAVAMLGSASSQKKIASKVDNGQHKIAVGEAIKLFS